MFCTSITRKLDVRSGIRRNATVYVKLVGTFARNLTPTTHTLHASVTVVQMH